MYDEIPSNTVVIAYNYINQGHYAKPWIGRRIDMARRKFINSEWWIPSTGEIIRHVPYTELDLDRAMQSLIDGYDTCRIWAVSEDGIMNNIWYYAQ